jgi:hypothetical protein
MADCNQVNSVKCCYCADATATVRVTERRNVLSVEIPLGWTVVLVPISFEVGLLLEYTCPQCNIDLHGKDHDTD